MQNTNIQNEPKIFHCYSARLASLLRRSGFEIIGTRINTRYPQFDVYLFYECPELLKVVEDYCQQKK